MVETVESDDLDWLASSDGEHDVERQPQDDHVRNAAASASADAGLEREWQNRRSRLQVIGFQEGFEQGREAALQDGFNEGESFDDACPEISIARTPHGHR